MASYTDEFLSKLRAYLCDNSRELAQKNKISQIPYYPNDFSLRNYKWTIIDLNDVGLGYIEMYNTAISAILKINGVSVESSRSDSFNFREVEDILLVSLNEKKISDTENRFNKK